MALNQAQIDHYFSGLHSKTGCRQVVPHLTKHPEWWTLRNSSGMTPLMRSLYARGMNPDIFSSLLQSPDVLDSLSALDHQGRNIWWYLFLYRSYKPGAEKWVPLFRERIPLQASPLTGRGIFIDLILRSPKRQWSDFFPTGAFGGQVYGMPYHTHKTWWNCSDQEATVAANWLLGVQKERHDNKNSITLNLQQCRKQDPDGMNLLPGPIQGALRLLELMRGLSSPQNWMELSSLNILHLGSKARARVSHKISRLRGQNREYGTMFLSEHDRQVLLKASPQAQGQMQVLRL